MKRENKIFYVGSLKITRIDEMTLRGAHPAVLLGENWQPAALEKHREWLIPENLDADDQTLVQSTHCWLVQSPEFTLLVDTASGNDKERPDKPVFHHLQTDFLAKLAAAGVSPQEVDYVLLTHLHVDHVGWNTRLVDGQWVPTFPKATYLMSATEAEHFTSPARDNDAAIPGIDIFNDSVLPVIKADRRASSHAVAAKCSTACISFPRPVTALITCPSAFSRRARRPFSRAIFCITRCRCTTRSSTRCTANLQALPVRRACGVCNMPQNVRLSGLAPILLPARPDGSPVTLTLSTGSSCDDIKQGQCHE